MIMADTKTEKTVAEELREAAVAVREGPEGLAATRAYQVTIDGLSIGGCPECRVAPEMDHPELLVGLLNAREPLASLLETAARIANAHAQDPAYEGLPEFRFCLECRDEETDCIQVIDGALAVARALNGSR